MASQDSNDVQADVRRFQILVLAVCLICSPTKLKFKINININIFLNVDLKIIIPIVIALLSTLIRLAQNAAPIVFSYSPL